MGRTKKDAAKPTAPKKTTAKKEKKLSFEDQVLARINMSDEEKLTIRVSDKIARMRIDCQTQITMIETSDIPLANQKLAEAKRDLLEAKKGLAESYYEISPDDTYESYAENINSHSAIVSKCERKIMSIEGEIADANTQIKAHKAILDKLNS